MQSLLPEVFFSQTLALISLALIGCGFVMIWVSRFSFLVAALVLLGLAGYGPGLNSLIFAISAGALLTFAKANAEQIAMGLSVCAVSGAVAVVVFQTSDVFAVPITIGFLIFWTVQFIWVSSVTHTNHLVFGFCIAHTGLASLAPTHMIWLSGVSFSLCLSLVFVWFIFGLGGQTVDHS